MEQVEKKAILEAVRQFEERQQAARSLGYIAEHAVSATQEVQTGKFGLTSPAKVSSYTAG